MSDIERLKRLKELTNDLSEHMEKFHERALGLAELAEKKMLMDNNELTQLVSEAVELTQKQDQMKAFFAEWAPGEDVPELLSEIEEIAAEFEEIIALDEEANRVISRFGSITSDSNEHKDMLGKYADKLAVIDRSRMSLDEYKAAVRPYEIFYETVNTTDTNERVTKAQTIYNEFDGDIITNLIFGKFYIIKDDKADVQTAGVGDVSKDVEIDAVTEEPIIEETPENTEEINTADIKLEAEESEEKTAEYPIYVGERDLGELIVTSKKSDVPVDQKEFKQLIKMPQYKYAFIKSCRSYTHDDMFPHEVEPSIKEAFGKAERELVEKGFIDSIHSKNMPDIFHMNPRGHKAITRYFKNGNTDLRNVVDKYTELRYTESTANIYLKEICLSKFDNILEQHFTFLVDNYIKFPYSSEETSEKSYFLKEESFSIGEAKKYSSLYLAAFISNAEEFESFDNNLKDVLASLDDPRFVIIGADNIEECRALFSYASSLNGKLGTADVFYFCALEQKFLHNDVELGKCEVIEKLNAYAEEFFGDDLKKEKAEDKSRDTGLIYCDHSDVGTASIISRDDMVITTKTFKNDMKDISLVRGIDTLADMTSVNEAYMKANLMHNKMNYDAAAILEELFDKGYANKITLDGFDTVYNVSCALEKCMSKTNTAWLNSKYNKNFKPMKVTPKEQISGPDNRYFTNMLLARIAHLNAAASVFNANEQTVSNTITTLAEYYCFCDDMLSCSNKIKIHNITVSVCLPTEKEIEGFIVQLGKHLENITLPVDILMTASYTKEECESYLGYITKTYEMFAGSKHIMYILSEDRFFDAETDQELTREAIRSYVDSLYEHRLTEKQTCSETENAAVVVREEYAKNTEETVEAQKSEEVIEEKNELTETAIEDAKSPEPYEAVLDSTDEKEEVRVVINRDYLLETVCDMLGKEKFGCASAYLKAIALQNKEYNQLYTALGYAVDDPALVCNYNSSVVSGIFDSESGEYSELTDYFRICAVLRTLFQGDPHDYQYKSLYATIQGYPYLTDDNKYVSELLYKLTEFKDEANGLGMDIFADYRVIENKNTLSMINKCVLNAKELFDYHFNNPIKENKALPRYLDTLKMILKKGDLLYDCLRAVSEDDRSDEMIEYVREYLTANFISSDHQIRAVSISADKIDAFIDYYWKEAGKIQREKHKSSKLVKELRNSLASMLMKMLTEIADWYYFVSLYTENDNQKTYEYEKSKIRELIGNALCVCGEIANSGDRSMYTKAGNNCIKYVLQEFRDKLEGTRIDNSNRFYYVDFLYYSEIMLDENFIPIIENELSEIDGFSPEERILRHASMPARDINDRIDEIFTRTPDTDLHLNDDYGCAKLIKEYLGFVSDEEWNDKDNDIEANSLEASKHMSLIKSNFIGTLELDQSYDKIDIDRKERLLLLADKYYEKTMKTKNFGFFKRMLDHCKHMVDANANRRKNDVRAHLENIKKLNADIPEAGELIAAAEQMMDIQNYTVVEDIINRIQQKDFSTSSVIESKDYLDDFIKDYENIFKILYPSKMSGPSNVSLINRLTRFSSGNQHNKFASDIISSFPLENNIQKIRSFLEAVGFKVDDMKAVSELNAYRDKMSCYDVMLKKPINNKKDNYVHPIYPFGSKALLNGFRVIYHSGKTDYDNILDMINVIGTSKSTIIIVNWAIELHDRRELARKIKAKMPDDKIFIVIDRVVMYYLADRNEESLSSISRILMQITAPFATFQPYTEDASKAIPSEMFMGRTKLLNDIESPKGANVICGGRQLGKSALLRMAKTEIDDDDVGNRAVYVEIKNLDHKNAALRVSQTLIDEGILDKGKTTDDWDELARNIKLRLNDPVKKKIPFFLLLIDEADGLFESSKYVDYNPIRALESLQANGQENFKFVFAGLRNLVKFERELSTAGNSTLPHIRVQMIKPFNSVEARELLEVPLHYLGVRFPKDKEYLISLILASTNYFPGLIHQYCASLIKALQEKDYADYNVDSTPPYELTETQIKKILSDENFNKEIKNKFEITLKLDTDNYYDIIVTMIAYCSYNEYSASGFTVADIMEVAEGFEINKITSQGIDKLGVLMDELCELNILRKNSEERYLFARHNFIQMLGKDKSAIDEKLIQYLGV